ncbi:T7SS effector LXG polymorphic toxin [Peribacillus frigoritolerans]|uniref:T7SS effector LXG polymorphic toxin n=1 Tax=Peribacillus frigoritolerans TaxID=450367 RepID=UPI0025711A9D|nr:T7SS effector LXG polymorphic toxin [Peribacillus frigoritolerans]WJE46698.1 T7SS effector LXG polymorphic toxin [Peribacillus frigoritolerans]
MSMIYESQTLVSAMQTRVGQYKDLKEQLTELKKGFESIVHLDDELQGQGAEAIKGFYKAQIDVVDSWLRLINRHVAFLSGIQGDTIEANLSETVVTVPFLEEELTNATRNSKKMVTAQKNDLKKILAGIDDIIQLEPFSDDAFFENIEKAETKRTQTIDKVNEIDHKWTTEYAKSEADQAAVTALMEQLKESSTRGGVVSPLYFNATAYKNSEAYKNLEVRKKETAQYLKVKKEEAENRRIKDLKAQLDHVTDPDEFLKIAKQIGYENLAPTQQQYVMQLEAAKQTADITKGIGVGLYDVGKDFVTGVWDFVTDPGETVEGVANSIMHPIQTYKYISKSISDSYERDMVNGDAYSRAHWVSYALGTVVTSVVGTKGAGAITKTGVATTKAAAVKGVTKAKELATIPNLLPYNPKNQLSLAGGVPYNVVNGVGLKDQLITMAKVVGINPRTRLPRTNGRWEGNPGNGKWYSENPEVLTVTGGVPVEFKNKRPIFSPWSKGQLKFKEGQLNGSDGDFKLVYEKLMKAKGFSSQNQAKNWLREKGLTPHHADDITIQLIPTKLHKNIPHIGSASDLRGGF